MSDVLKRIISEIATMDQERRCYKEMFEMQVKLVGELEVKRFELQQEMESIQERIAKLEERNSSRDLNSIIDSFVQEVEKRAEEKMLKTGKLEGSHYAAMKQVAKEWSDAAKNTQIPHK